jgi:hypothetical protein
LDKPLHVIYKVSKLALVILIANKRVKKITNAKREILLGRKVLLMRDSPETGQAVAR